MHLIRLSSCVLAVLATVSPALAADKLAGKCTTVTGAVLARGEAGWRALGAGSLIADGTLVVALPHAELQSLDNSVKVVMAADVGHHGPYPVLESAVVMKADAGADLGLELKRGIVVLSNLKAGAAKVRVHIRGDTVDVTLKTEGTRVGFEIYSRHAPGIPPVDGKGDDPTTQLFCVVLKGEVLLGHGDKSLTLRAPPGPAILFWDSVLRKPEVLKLEELPDNLKPAGAKEIQLIKDMGGAASALNGKDKGEALSKLITSENKLHRLVGVTCAGALDDLDRLFGALEDPRNADTRDHAVLVLRHWIGREPGQVKKLYEALVARKATPVQAKAFIHLLFGFTEDEKQDSTTYEVLIHYLTHSRLAVRELARWHLVRLAPAGKEIAYDAAGTEAQRREAVARWQALIPSGKLPPRR